MTTICNQTFVKDSHRDKAFIATMKCALCGEQSSIGGILPIIISNFTDRLDAFQNLHEIKGCNKEQLLAPDWACGSVTVGVADVNTNYQLKNQKYIAHVDCNTDQIECDTLEAAQGIIKDYCVEDGLVYENSETCFISQGGKVLQLVATPVVARKEDYSDEDWEHDLGYDLEHEQIVEFKFVDI